MRDRSRRTSGFTLIELMITVAVVGVLSAVAYPAYQDSIRKGRRADARALLQAAGLAQEKYRLNNATFASATTDLAPPCPTSGNCNSEQTYYRLATPTGVSATGYTLTANAVAASQTADTGCTAITYAVSGSTITYGPSNTCWGK